MGQSSLPILDFRRDADRRRAFIESSLGLGQPIRCKSGKALASAIRASRRCRLREATDKAFKLILESQVHRCSQFYSHWRAKSPSFRIKQRTSIGRIAADLTDAHELIAAKDQRIFCSPL